MDEKAIARRRMIIDDGIPKRITIRFVNGKEVF